MDPISTSTSLFDRFNAWIQESIMIKLVSIGFLVLILLIPSSWIQSLITERQLRADETMDEIASKWSGNQTVAGPILVIPYKRQEYIDTGKDGIKVNEYIEKAFFLPNELNITGQLSPSTLSRGIFDAVVYETKLDIQSQFSAPDFKSLAIENQNVLWKDAYLVFGISDLRGISDNPVFKIGTENLTTEPSNNLGISSSSVVDADDHYRYTTTEASSASTSGIIAKLNWQSQNDFSGKVGISLPLKGSNRLDFVPAGKTTTVKLSGSWGNPSFDGEFLPSSRTVTEKDFEAQWKVLHFNRPFAQQWTNSNQHLGGSEFGVKLRLPVDQYQKSMRTSKYGALVILLTFIALFLVEIIQKIRIHPFQYILIGAALTIYYTLLISLSEHIGYNVAYLISSIATVGLISLYASTFLQSMRLNIFFMIILGVFYLFIFVIIQEQDYSLLIGSIGLFLIIGVLMFFSRKISWYKSSVPPALPS
jgi:inner membrane protein